MKIPNRRELQQIALNHYSNTDIDEFQRFYRKSTAERYSYFYFLSGFFFHEHSRFIGQQGKGKTLYLSPLCHFHPPLRHLDISQAITAESSPLHIVSSRTRTGNPWFPNASHQPLRYALLAIIIFNH